MNEQKDHILQKVIQQLPQYEPPDAVWEGIAQRLPLLELPSYEPPVSVWKHIDNQLFVEQDTQIEPIRYRLQKKWYWAAASVAFLCLATTYWLFNTKNNVSETIIVTSETIDNQLLVENDESVEQAFAQVETFCKTAVPVCEEPEFKSLKLELDDLNNAVTNLKNAISDYNSNPDLVTQLAHIENERADVLKKMMEKM